MDFSFAIDTMWVLIASALVFFMQAGFAMVETGFTRAKNAGNIIMKNLMDFAVGSLVFWFIGFGIMFGSDIGGLIGKIDIMTKESYDFLGLNIPLSAFIIFQTVFCATAATIVSGAMAERTRFKSYLIYSFFICLIIYPIAGHWIWGGGWLSQLGFHDFAGSTAVHSIGGWSALVGAFILGPRIGKFDSKGNPIAIPGHSLTLGALGVFILWFGWFGFNPGSTLSGMASETIGHIFMTTNLAAASGAVFTMLLTWIKYGKPDVSMTLNGALAGLVAITAGCDVIGTGSAVVIGFLTSFVVLFGIEFIEKTLKIDDPVGAIGVHGLSGAFGTLCVGLFASDGGLFFGGGTSLLTIQLIGVLSVAAWTLSSAYVLFKIIDITVGLRVTNKEEHAGLDQEEHGIDSYADFAPRII